MNDAKKYKPTRSRLQRHNKETGRELIRPTPKDDGHGKSVAVRFSGKCPQMTNGRGSIPHPVIEPLFIVSGLCAPGVDRTDSLWRISRLGGGCYGI